MNDLVVDCVLPADFFEKLGRYVATIAYIDDSLHRLMMHRPRIDPGAERRREGATGIRLDADRLRAEIGALSATYSGSIGDTLRSMAAELAHLTDWQRSVTMHGAEGEQSSSDGYNLRSTGFPRTVCAVEGSPAPDWCDEAEMDFAIESLDRLLRRLIALEVNLPKQSLH